MTCRRCECAFGRRKRHSFDAPREWPNERAFGLSDQGKSLIGPLIRPPRGLRLAMYGQLRSPPASHTIHPLQAPQLTRFSAYRPPGAVTPNKHPHGRRPSGIALASRAPDSRQRHPVVVFQDSPEIILQAHKASRPCSLHSSPQKKNDPRLTPNTAPEAQDSARRRDV